MSSAKQIEANRRNALKSTGPTSHQGKQQSRRNALRHGLTAETIVGSLEDADDYAAFEAAIIADYDAETAVEREMVLRLASVLWRLRRATTIETALFASVTENGESDPASAPEPVPSLVPANRFEHFQTTAPLSRRSNCEHDREVSVDRARRLLDSCLRLASLPSYPLYRLHRYEHLLWRQARQLIITLEALRRRQSKPQRRSFPFALRPRPDDFPFGDVG